MEDRVAGGGFIPLGTRVHLGHAVVQSIAREAGVELLHLKGPALLPGLREAARVSADVDVLVKPGQIPRLVAALGAHGWEQRSDFGSGSAFHHAANWFHDNWGYVDVHTHWPGPRADKAQVYAEFAAGGLTQEIAHVPCPVPNRTAQILILVLHAGRSPGGSTELPLAWHAISDEEQAEVLAMATRLHAETGLAAGLGQLDTIVGDPTAELWRVHARGGTRLEEWRARVRAAPNRRAAVRVLVSAVLVNRDHLRMELGHPPTRREMVVRQVQRIRVLGKDVFRAARSRTARSEPR